MSDHFNRLEWSGSKLHLPNSHDDQQQLLSAAQLLEQAEFVREKNPPQQFSNTNYLTEDDIECGPNQQSTKQLVIINRNDGNDEQENEILVVAANESCQNSKQVIDDILMQTDTDDNNDFSKLYSNNLTTSDYTDMTSLTEDNWVHDAGVESKVQVAAEQINSHSQGTLDVEVPSPAVQASYTVLRPYSCDFCKRRFRKKVSLVYHIASYHNNRLHLCKICNSRFSTPKDLINHMKIHSKNVKETKQEDEDYLYYECLNDTRSSCDVNWKISDESLPMQTQSNHGVDEKNTYEMNGNNVLLKDLCPTARDRNPVALLAENKATLKGRISRLKPKANTSQIDYDFLDSYTPSPSKSNSQLKVEPHDRKSFICYLCGLSFAREKALSAHLKIHQNGSLEGKKCDELFTEEKSFEMHKKVHEFDGSASEYEPNELDATDICSSDSNTDSQIYGEYYCSECGLAFHRLNLLKRHRKIHNKNGCSNGGDINSCNICGEKFVEAVDLLAHTKLHGQCFNCTLCGDTFYDEISIGQHLEAKHSTEISDYTCMFCGKDFRDRRALNKHVWDHSNEKNYNCSKCGKKFQNKTRLKRHLSSHRNKSVECSVCHELFPDGRTLSNHRHAHNSNASAKLFPCHECGKSFGSRSSQQIHVRIHTGEKPYGCSFCWKAFADGGTLRKHERIHTGEKPYACPVCSRAFNQRVVLREHIRSHHSGIDPIKGAYHCKVCQAEMDSPKELIQHLIQHSDVNTAMKRQPTIGPRKYQRRRKLKPHEIASLKHLKKLNELHNNQSDSDGSQVDLSLNNSNGFQESINDTANFNSKSKRIDDTDKISTTDVRIMNGDYHGKLYSADDNKKNGENIVFSRKTIIIKLNKNRKRNSLNKCKIQNEIQNSLTTSVQDASDDLSDIQEYDGTCARVRNKLPTLNKTKDEVKSKTTTINCNATNLNKTIIESSPTEDVPTKRKMASALTKTPIYNTTNSLIKPSTIVDDYDIISPDLHPPKQISISPLHIKHEAENEPQIQQIHQPLASDIYDNQLLLECPSLRNDLEDILQSAMKLEKDSKRTRFASGSSTQFEASDEEHFIKHEPASANLSDIVNRNTNFNNAIELNDTRNTSSRQSWFTSTANITPTKCLNINSQVKSPTTSPNYTANTSMKRTLRKSEGNHTAILSADVSEAFLDYIMESTFNTNTPPNASNSFSSLSAVISAADATAAAQQHLATPARKHHRYFECEMCSAVFSDRAQLLNHVPTHI